MTTGTPGNKTQQRRAVFEALFARGSPFSPYFKPFWVKYQALYKEMYPGQDGDTNFKSWRKRMHELIDETGYCCTVTHEVTPFDRKEWCTDSRMTLSKPRVVDMMITQELVGEADFETGETVAVICEGYNSEGDVEWLQEELTLSLSANHYRFKKWPSVVKTMGLEENLKTAPFIYFTKVPEDVAGKFPAAKFAISVDPEYRHNMLDDSEGAGPSVPEKSLPPLD